MKNILLISAIILFIFSFQEISAADIITKNYSYKDFSEVNVSYGMAVSITQSDNYSIKIKADEADFQYLEVEKSGDELNIFINKNNYRKKSKINIEITMPALTAIGLSGGSEAEIKMNVKDKSFNANLSGGSEIGGNLNCGNIELQLSGGSQVNFSGSGKDTQIDGSGGSICELKEFSVANVDASLSGGSEVTIHMNGKLNASQSGGSQITYYGNAEVVDNKSSGGSKIIKGS